MHIIFQSAYNQIANNRKQAKKLISWEMKDEQWMLKDECIIAFKLFGGFSLGQMYNQIFVIVELLN